MKLQGNLSLLSGGSILGARVENLSSDPVSPYAGQVWYNTTDLVYKGFNGTDVIQFAVGGALANYVLKAGDTMTGTLTLSNGATVTGLAAPSADSDAATKLYTDTGLGTKQNTITGAATTITGTDLTISRALASDVNGKVAVSATTAAELGYVNGVTSAIQTQIDSKQPTITGAATTITSADLTASRLLQSDTNGKVSASTVTTTEVGYLSGITSSVQTQIDAQVAASGDTMTGNLVMGANKVTSSATPSEANDLTNKSYVDNLVVGLSWKNAARAATTAALPAATYANGTAGVGATLTGSANGALTAQDGITLVANDKLIVKNQAAALQNGIFVVTQVGDVGTPFILTRAVDSDTAAEIAAAAIFVMEGTDNGDFAFVCTNEPTVVVGTDAINFTQFTGAASWTAGTGIIRVGNTVNVNLGAGISELPSDEVGLDLYSAAGLFLTEDGSTDSTTNVAKLAVKIDGSTLARSANGVKIADAGVTATQIATSVAGDGLTGGAGTSLAVGAGTGITVQADTVSFDETYGDGRYINTAGDTMTGALTLAGAPTVDLHAATKLYVDTGISDLSTTLNGIISTLSTRVDAGYFLYTSGAANTTHTVTHNMNRQYVGVTVIDTNDQVILPQSITYDTANALTVTFNSAIQCKVVVNGVKP